MTDLIRQKAWFDSPEFEEKYHCEAQLGCFFSPRGTYFHLWAPTADEVFLNIYADGCGGEAMERIAMQRGERGLWLYKTPRNLDGMYYDYDVSVDGLCRRTADPYARACGLNGERSMALNLRRTDPPGWEGDAAPARQAEDIIYELHVKDFSWDPLSGVPEEYRGKYLAFTLPDTTLGGDGRHPTCLNYLRRLGITHVQLQPIYDFGSVDEAGDPNQFNWGYDPVNYNIPEGSYSTDPFHGEVRIRELKQAIQALHGAGLRVIMDVVYNHTYSLDSCLQRTAPWYFYRQRPDGSASNGSGCGSELATERSMCARYILDSVLYWAEEYHIDGFRFDLMGLIDAPLMNRIQQALDMRYGAGEKLVYGEPWGADQSSARPGTLLCHKGAFRHLHPAIGAFCDNTRDAVKGGVMDEHSRGFANGSGITAAALLPCLRGWAGDGERCWAKSPAQTITYLSCHDDWTLWDKLVLTMDSGKKFLRGSPEILRSNKLAAAILFCCQGRLFLHAGEELGRTKRGVKNSYRSSPEINKLDWTRAWRKAPLADYYRGLIALRGRVHAFCDKSDTAAYHFPTAVDIARNCVCALVDNPGEEKWQKLLLIFNCSEEARAIPLPAGEWQVLVDENNSFRWQEPAFVQEKASVAPMSALILGETNGPCPLEPRQGK